MNRIPIIRSYVAQRLIVLYDKDKRKFGNLIPSCSASYFPTVQMSLKVMIFCRELLKRVQTSQKLISQPLRMVLLYASMMLPLMIPLILQNTRSLQIAEQPMKFKGSTPLAGSLVWNQPLLNSSIYAWDIVNLFFVLQDDQIFLFVYFIA